MIAPSSDKILYHDSRGISEASDLLRGGALVAIPTETVYGLAADARNPEAVARIFAAKKRPSFNPLIVHLPDLDAAEKVAYLSPIAKRIAARFWPGPLTMVLPSRGVVADLVTAGLPTIAVRVPRHDVARAILRAFNGPIAAPSANPSGSVSPTQAQHVIDAMADQVAAVVDGGACEIGLESTIIAPSDEGVRLLREGGIAREEIEALIGTQLLADLTPGRVEAPGQLERHYATRMPLVIGLEALPNEVTIGFGDQRGDFNLAPNGDLVEAAARLFELMRQAETLALHRGAQVIRVVPIPDRGIGRAINDRLRRASVPASFGA